MPQTEEEHLENESMEDDRSTKDPNDAEVTFSCLVADPLTLLGSGVGSVAWRRLGCEPSFKNKKVKS